MIKTTSMTVDELAVIVQNAFVDQFVDQNEFLVKQFHQIDQRFVNVENRLDKVEDRLGNVETRLDQVEIRLDNVEKHLGSVEKQNKETNYRLALIEQKHENFMLRLDKK